MTDSIWTRAFWQATAERVVSTAAQSGAAYAVTAGTLDVLHFNWLAFAGIAGGGALLSLLKSLGANVATKTGPSLVSAEQVVPAESPIAAVKQTAANPHDLDGDHRDDKTGRYIPRHSQE